MRHFFSSFARLSARFRADTRGVAAIEMAFLAPVALGLLSLGVAGGQTLITYHKVVLTAHTVTDLVSRTPFAPDSSNPQGELLNQSDLDIDLALGTLVMYPKDTTTMTIVLSELKVNAANNTGVVVWSEPYPSTVTALPINTVIPLDPSYAASGAAYLIYGQVTYTFQPLGGVFSLPAMTLSSTETLTIRQAPQLDINWGS